MASKSCGAMPNKRFTLINVKAKHTFFKLEAHPLHQTTSI
jgi:hypothetical protein